MGLSENYGTLFWGPCRKDPAIWGTILGSPIVGNPYIVGSVHPGPSYGALKGPIYEACASSMNPVPKP